MKRLLMIGLAFMLLCGAAFADARLEYAQREWGTDRNF